VSALQDRLDEALGRLRRAGTDLQDVEVKKAAGGLPQTAVESVSAFANSDGGMLILGLDEAAGFVAAEIDAAKLASDLASACVDQLEPPIRPDIDIATVDGKSVVVAVVEGLPPARKPCYVKNRGMDRGSYIRTHDGDRRLSTYEIHVLASSQGQPLDDTALVPHATVDDLDPELVRSLTRRLRATRGGVFAQASDDEILRLLGVAVDSEHGRSITLAGLLSLGRYPQQFFPQLDATFVAYPTPSGEPLADGTRFTDNQSIDGPIPMMVAEALAAVRRNMKRRSVIVGLGREDRWEYPEEAVREIVANALMHRDYHALAHGAQVRIALYPDRLEVTSPGGLYGPVVLEDLGAEPVSSSRNARLAKLLEDVEVSGTGRTVCENRGSGLLAAAAALRAAGIEPPDVVDNVREFKIIIRNHGLLDEQALEWLSSIDTAGLSDRQRLGLAFLHRNRGLTNQQYRALTGCDALTATRDLTGMAGRGLIEKSRDRRWTVWHLVGEGPGSTQQRLALEPSSSVVSRRDRRAEIRGLLAEGPRSARELGTALGLTSHAVLYWLRRLEDDHEVAPTSTNRRSPRNRWQLVERR
jgi:ATP-dependent DNA helicase RecG